MSERPEFPTRRDVIESIVEEYLNNIHTGFAARVQSYDAATQTADLQPLVRFPVKQSDGSYVMEDLPTLPSVPILFPRSGAWFIAMSVEVGDSVLVHCLESSHGAWEAGQGDATDPGDIARHHLAHAVATPGYFPIAKALANAPPSAGMVIGNDANPNARIALTPNGIEIGGSVSFVALASLVTAQLNTLKDAIATAGVTPMDGGAAFKAALLAALASWPSNIAATSTKAG